MEIIDVTHLSIDKVKDIYFEEQDTMSFKEDKNEVFKDSWVLVESRYYIIKIFVFDRDGHKVRFTPNQQFKLKLDGHFKLISQNSKSKPIYLV